MDAAALPYRDLSDEELRTIARDRPPSVPAERAALVRELHRRSEERKHGPKPQRGSTEATGGNPSPERDPTRRPVTVLLAVAGVVVLAAYCAKVVDAPSSTAVGSSTPPLHTGGRYTTDKGVIACGSVREFKRMVELSGDREAGLKFLAGGGCWILNRSRTVTYENNEGDHIARVREPGEVDSWYMLDTQLQP